jgi:hypothetical protein
MRGNFFSFDKIINIIFFDDLEKNSSHISVKKENPVKSNKRKSYKLNVAFILSFILIVLVPSLKAQEAEETEQINPEWRKRPGLALKIGTYLPSLNTILRVDSETLGRGTEIDFEDLLQLDKSPLILRGEAEVPVASWLSLDLGFYVINRSNTRVIDRDIQIGDTIFNINQTVKAKFNATYLQTNFKFYIIRKPRLDFGVWAGANVAFFNFSLEAQELGETFSEGRDVWAPIPAVGIHASYTLFRNFYIFGKAGYFYYGLSDNLKFNNWSLDININYYFYKFLGIGVSYEYNRAELNGELGDLSGEIVNRLGGIQFYLLIGF